MDISFIRMQDHLHTEVSAMQGNIAYGTDLLIWRILNVILFLL